MLPIVILAGGLATRLYPLTRKIPKALLDVNGEPFIAHQLRLLAKQRILDVVICIGYLAEPLRDFVGNGEQFGLRIQYSLDGEKLLGTGGAIRKALPLLGENFFVIYGDSYLLCDFASVENRFGQCECSSLMTIHHNQGLWDASNISLSNGRILNYDNHHHTADMEYIDYGLSVFNTGIFNLFPPNLPFDLGKVYNQQIETGQLAVYEVHERFYEIGSLNGLADLRNFLSGQNDKRPK
jgi:MurNAc alpha-1-phosphate uridylyltransferase